MRTRTREIAHVGIFGSIDNPIIVTEKDLKEINETFPDQKTAPIQFGHWAEAANPRFANVVAVSYDDTKKVMTGTIEEDDVLAKAVDDGYYPDVSIGAKQRASDGKMYLHHLAYLGEEAPAIKDLKKNIKDSLAASDDPSVIRFPSTAAKELYLSDEKPKQTNATGKNVDSSAASGAVSTSFAASGGSADLQTTKERRMTDEEIKALQEENVRLKTDVEAKDKLLSDEFSDRKKAGKEALKKAMAGKFTEGDQAKILALADSFDQGKKIELSDGDAKRSVNPISILTEVFSSMKLPVKPGMMNLSDPDASPIVIQEKSDSARMRENM
jgi:hypothetical protein